MRFRKSEKLTEAQFCDVCQKRQEKVKVIPLYQDTLKYVCSSCYSAYFKRIEKVETSRLVKFRPANVRRDRYMMRSVFASSMITDMIAWPLIGGAIKGLCLLCTLAYSDIFHGTIPFFMQCIMGVYAFFTVLGLLNAVRLFVGSLLRGVNTARRIILLFKIAEYAALIIWAVNGIF